jgi:site-specific recombinase XerD
MGRSADLPGAAHLELAAGVVHLDPTTAVFEGMLQGWARQQRTRYLNDRGTIEPRVALVRRLADFSGLYPWQWTPAEAEAFMDHLRSGERPIVMSTARGYENSLRLFLEYLLDQRYGWVMICQDRFGQVPQQVFHESNSVVHVTEYEGQPGRRPLTYDEVEALFDAADGLVEEIRARGRKGALTAMRDAAVLKTVYAFGLRRQEAWGLDVTDLRRNPKLPQFGQYAGVLVRYGKSSRGSPPKRRTVLLVPEMDWIITVLQQWIQEVRPLLSPGSHPALWVTERRGRLSMRGINEAFVAARDAAELPGELDLHCLRHSFITHLTEFDYPERFVQEEAGHVYASTTAIYTGVSEEYRNRLLERSLRQRHAELWGEAR